MKTEAKEKKGLRFQFEAMKEQDFIDIAAGLKQLAADIQDFWTTLYMQSFTSSDESNPDKQ